MEMNVSELWTQKFGVRRKQSYVYDNSVNTVINTPCKCTSHITTPSSNCLLPYQYMTPRALSPELRRPKREASTLLHKYESSRMCKALLPLPMCLNKQMPLSSLPTWLQYLVYIITCGYIKVQVIIRQRNRKRRAYPIC